MMNMACDVNGIHVFSDLERSVCRMVHGQVATIAWLEANSVCGSHSIGIPLMLVFPYVCQLFQCLRQYKDTKEKTTLFNALKYSTAVLVIFLSALKYHVFPDRWTNFYQPLWLLSSIVNSLYSFYWDIARDWDLSGFTRVFKFSKPSLVSYLLYGRKWARTKELLKPGYLSICTSAGILLGNRKQHDLARCMNIQILPSSSSQLHDCICNHYTRDSSTLPMDILSSRMSGIRLTSRVMTPFP